MFIFAGSYERFIFGYSASPDCSEPQEVVKHYTFAAHKSAVKCLVAAGPYVASGGADDLIHLYDMKAESDLGVLMNPSDGAVPCLEFYTPEGRSSPSHMLSGSADGAIHIWRCKDWEHLKALRGHKGGVNSLAVHHSGKLALSTARDRAIRMWNLTNGRVSYTAPLEAESDQVAFLRSGDSYLLLAGNRITVHSTAGEGGLRAAYTAPRRILCTASQDDSLVLMGLEDGSVRVWDVRTSGVVAGWERAHSSRVRGMDIMQEGSGTLPTSLVTASSDGAIKLWDTRRLGDGSGGSGASAASATCTAQVSTGARLTCLAAVDPSKVVAARAPPANDLAAVGSGGASLADGKGPGKKGAKRALAAADGAKPVLQQQWKGGKEPAAAAASGGAAEGALQGKQQQQQQQQQGIKRQQPQALKKQQQGKQQQQQQQHQQPSAKKAQLRRGGHGGGRGDDDPGFEIVPAPEYGGPAGTAVVRTAGGDAGDEDRAGPSGRPGPHKQHQHRQPQLPKQQSGREAEQRTGKAGGLKAGMGLKRRSRDGDEEGEQGGGQGPAAGGPGAGPSGLQPQSPAQPQKGKQQQQRQGKRPGGEDGAEGRCGEQIQRPAKKFKVGGQQANGSGGAAGAGKGGDGGMRGAAGGFKTGRKGGKQGGKGRE